jgi:hypothetical protein
MLGGAFLAYEGAEKVYEALSPHAAHQHEAAVGEAPADPRALENVRVASAIRTDFILSAEIMALSLSMIDTPSFWMRAAVLFVVAIGVTVVVYGAVAIIVKADDFGVWLARKPGAAVAALGRGIVAGVPWLLKALSIVGTAAMLWVGGGIVLHGLYEYGFKTIGHFPQDVAAWLGIGGLLNWLVQATLAGLFGLALGAAIIPLVEHAVAPLVRRVRQGKRSKPSPPAGGRGMGEGGRPVG